MATASAPQRSLPTSTEESSLLLLAKATTSRIKDGGRRKAAQSSLGTETSAPTKPGVSIPTTVTVSLKDKHASKRQLVPLLPKPSTETPVPCVVPTLPPTPVVETGSKGGLVPLLPKVASGVAAPVSPAITLPKRRNANRPKKYKKESKVTILKSHFEEVPLEVLKRHRKIWATLQALKRKAAKPRSNAKSETVVKKRTNRGTYKCGDCQQRLGDGHDCPFVKVPAEELEQLVANIPDSELATALMEALPLEL